MDRGHLTEIIETILNTPTAPFHEYGVCDTIAQLLAPCNSIQLRQDLFGNLIVSMGPEGKVPKWVFGAHMDHPGFVELPDSFCNDFSEARIKDRFVFLGGVPDQYLLKDFPIEEFERFAMWKLPAFERKDGQIWSRSCDDLIGCAVIVALLIAIDHSGIGKSCGAVFTRAEEVGFVGATKLAEEWPFESGSCFVSIETSVPVGETVMGGGPICRVGDRISIFDHNATKSILMAAEKHSVSVQRALLDRGACEASVLTAFGIRVAGISVSLGNYHNCGEGGEIATEYIALKDVEGLFDLMAAIIEEFPDGPNVNGCLSRQNFMSRVQKHTPFIESTTGDFRQN